MYELKLIKLDHKGVPNDVTTIKVDADLAKVKEIAEKCKDDIDLNKAFAKNTFYIELLIYEDQDLIVYQYRQQIQDQIEW